MRRKRRKGGRRRREGGRGKSGEGYGGGGREGEKEWGEERWKMKGGSSSNTCCINQRHGFNYLPSISGIVYLHDGTTVPLHDSKVFTVSIHIPQI